jgi:hypothetical protein
MSLNGKLLSLNFLLRLQHPEARQIWQQPRQDGRNDGKAAGKSRPCCLLEELAVADGHANHGANSGHGTQEPEAVDPVKHVPLLAEHK